MQRKIIQIDEALCNGCGQCIKDCAEGALRLVDGVAKLVKDDYCDGLGACIGTCPTGALTIIERESPPFDPVAVQEHTGHRHAPAAAAPTPLACGCPGSMTRIINQQKPALPPVMSTDLPTTILPTGLSQWPVQLHLVSPHAPYLNGRDLVVLSTCAPVASADVHWRFIRGRSVVVACPKLDNTDPYVEKLAAIMSSNRIERVIVVTMEVPCCRGLRHIVRQALEQVPEQARPLLEECEIGLDGGFKESHVQKI